MAPTIKNQALFIAAFIYLALCMDRTVAPYDEGLILLGAVRVLEGAVPHRDFFTSYGPGQFYLLAGLYKLFGVSVLVERVWDTVVRSGSVVLVSIIVAQAAPRWQAILAAVASAVFLGSVGFYGYTVFPTLTAILASVALIIPHGDVRPTPARLVAAGVCAGIAVAVRYDIGFFAAVTMAVLLALQMWLGPPRRLMMLDAVRSAIFFCLGCGLVLVPVAIFFVLSGAIPDLIFDVATYPSEFYVRTRSLPFPPLSSFSSAPESFVVYLPIIVCLSALPTILSIWRSRRPLGWTLIMLVILTCLFFGKGMVRVSTIHMIMSLVTSLALMGILVQPLTGRGTVARYMVCAAFLAVGYFTYAALGAGLYNAGQNVAWIKNPASDWCPVRVGLERLACFETTPDTTEAVRYVHQHTSPDDPIFVGLSSHDKIFINDILFYFAVARPVATKWYEFGPGLQTTRPIQEDMIAELRLKKPKLIVKNSSWDDYLEANDSALRSHVTVLDDYLSETYEPVATFGTDTVLQRR